MRQVRQEIAIMHKMWEKQIDGFILGAVTIGERERFETGMNSMFSLIIRGLIDSYGKWAVERLEHYIDSNLQRSELVGEIFIGVGVSTHEPSREARRLLLEKYLHSSDIDIVDYAVAGLWQIGDAKSVPVLQETADRLKDTGFNKTVKDTILSDISGDNFI